MGEVIHTGEKVSRDDQRIGFTTDPDLERECRERIYNAKVEIVFTSPFYGELTSRLTPVCADAWCTSMATDGRHMFFNTRWMSTLTNEELLFVMVHEVMHCVFDHMARTKDHSLMPLLSNVAQDFIVNGVVVSEVIGVMPKMGLYDKKFRGWTSEEVYEYLLQNKTEKEVGELGERLLDMHLEPSIHSENNDGEIEETPDGLRSNAMPNHDAHERDKIRDEIEDALLNAFESDPDRDKLNNSVKRIVKSLRDPQIDWRNYLMRDIASTVKNDVSFMRPSRRSQHLGVCLPGLTTDRTIDVMVALDLSGSIGEVQMRDFISELYGICRTYVSFKLRLVTFNGAAHDYKEFDEYNVNEMDEYPYTGGGLTRFEAVFDMMKEMRFVPKRLIIFTDGLPNATWGDPDYCPTVFVVHNQNRDIVAPYGVTIPYTEKIRPR